MRALCVGRHEFLSDHLRRFFRRFDLETTAAVGIEGAAAAAASGARPDVVICDYDLLATMPLDSWERDATLSRTPVVAVSMTRRPDELHPLDVNGIGGFLYLPRLERGAALAALRAVTAAAPVASPLADSVSRRAVAAPSYSLGAAERDRPRPIGTAATADGAAPSPRSSPPSARDEAPAR